MRAIRNIGIFAHVDAGKTTLSERLLSHSGEIRRAGAVDQGTAHTDRLEIERRRGISVKSTCVPLTWNGVTIHLIDTPGHADFAAEVERSMWALDGAVVVLSAKEGVQPQTEAVFRALRENRIPALLFVNKIDREGADVASAMEQARRRLCAGAFLLDDDDAAMAALAEVDEAALEDYVEGRVYDRAELEERILPRVHGCELYPALSGSALKDVGVEALLDAVCRFLPSPAMEADGPLAGVVFAVEDDPVMGRGAHVRLFSGSLSNRQSVQIPLRAVTDYSDREHMEERKVTQIRAMSAEGRGADLGRIAAGEIACVYGLTGVRVGSVIGDESALPRPMQLGRLRAPMIMVRVSPQRPEDRPALHRAMETLAAEDPLLDVKRYQGVEHIRLMGTIQLEVLQEELPARFGIPVDFGAPEVIYRETIRQRAEGFVAYLAPKPCWAVIKFDLEPLPRGSGIQYASETPVRRLQGRYQHQIEQALPLALSQGMLGWQVDDVRITLVDGEDHQFHTHPLDFIVATPMALMDGLRRAGSQLLEPVAEMQITLPSHLGGKVMSEIVAMRGQTVETSLSGDEGEMTLTARVPVSMSVDFPTRLQMLTGGRGQLSIRLFGYQDCDLEMGRTCPRRGVNPLDTAKYILAARNALDGEIF
ncbi:MAG: TetM/TetW/TetO/TetS family tetracycline resistance ribosomal protection protein [Clostridia bacterium]|nr:TetM/TetW/TetO/TetS family tetracycline resistance ribosomal protection protein [Clostridia bacterium]